MDEVIKLLTKTHMRNGYPMKFVDCCRNQVAPKPIVYTLPEKSVHITLLYGGELNSIILRRWLTSAIKKAYYTANLIIVGKTKHMVHHIPELMASMITSHPIVFSSSHVRVCVVTYT
ncbi:unnamed protein product [Heterobilharzia americana]|nr:unnamed protein product [Heterobilharzia americana]